jgi:hypothetical protein
MTARCRPSSVCEVTSFLALDCEGFDTQFGKGNVYLIETGKCTSSRNRKRTTHASPVPGKWKLDLYMSAVWKADIRLMNNVWLSMPFGSSARDISFYEGRLKSSWTGGSAPLLCRGKR